MHCLKCFTKLLKTQCNSSWFMVAISCWTAHSSSYVVCVQFLYMHCFQVSPKEQTQDCESQWLYRPWDTWYMKMLLRHSLTGYTLHWSIVTEQVLKWYYIISSVCWLCPLLPLAVLSETCLSALCHPVLSSQDQYNFKQKIVFSTKLV